MSTPTEERAWWDQIATDPAELERNIFDHTIGTTEQCCLEILSGLTPLPNPPAVILDLGCGVGRLASAFGRSLPDYAMIGVDISPAIVRTARKRNHAPNVHYEVGDGRTIPDLWSLTVDAVYSMLMFQHIPADACAGYVTEVARVLKPGGRFRFQSVIGEHDGFLSHQSSDTEMCGWCEDAGLEVLGSEVSRLHWEWRWMTARKP